MRVLKFLFFIFLIIPLIYSNDVNCPNSHCGNNFLSIKYPFKLQGRQPQICSNYINLSCTPQDNVFLNLPFSGDFYVDDIDYNRKQITLDDPQNCLLKRLMNLNLSSSPFAAISSQNYTFYNCPDLFSDGLFPIDCLSNDSHVIVASSSMSAGEMMKSYGCSTIVTEQIPVAWHGQFDGIEGIPSSLMLTWDFPHCKDCEESNFPEPDKPPSNLSMYIGLFVFLGMSCCACLMRIKSAITQGNGTASGTTREEVAMTTQTTMTTTIMRPQSVGVGVVTSPDEHYLKTMMISTILEGNFGPLEAHGLGTSCTICLEEYSPRDTIKCLTFCHHYFHAKCIDHWLQKNSSCPVCRTSILGVKL